jgi:Amt family ammonium transporter
MAERAKLWVYFAFGVWFTLIYSVTSHWIWHSGGWLFGLGMQDFAGSTVVHYQGALAALAGALLLGPRIGKFGHDGRANPIPGHNMPYAVLGTLILWFGWFGFNPGSTLAVVTGDKLGYFGYVALTTNLAARPARSAGSQRVGDPAQAGRLDDAERRARRARRDHGRVGLRRAVGGGRDRARLRLHRRRRRALRRADRHRRPDRRGRRARDVRRLGDARDGLFAVPALARTSPPARAARLHGLVPPARRAGARALAVGAFTFTASFGCLWTMKRLWGIRVERDVETAGLDVSEHGMWGYPEFYIPGTRGYGTEAHGHLGLAHGHGASAPVPAIAPDPAPEPAV